MKITLSQNENFEIKSVNGGLIVPNLTVGSRESDSTVGANAVEVMRDGKVFIKGIGGYDGTNPTGENVKDLAAALDNARTAALSELADRVSALDTTSINDFASLKQAFLDLVDILAPKSSVAGQ